MKSNTIPKILEMSIATYVLKLKDDDLISRKTLNFIRNRNFVFFGLNGNFSSSHGPKKGGMR